MEKVKDKVEPKGKWEFGEDVTAAFDDMLSRSIPQYDVMRDACFNIGSEFVQRGTDIVDLGCSRGEALFRYVDRFGALNHYIAVEVSEPMLKILNKRFKNWISIGKVSVKNTDLRKEFPPCSASVIQSILTLQFIPIEYRQSILQKVYDSLTPGGAFIIVEKVLGSTTVSNDLMVKLYWELKKENGYSYDDIHKKATSLEGVLVPVTAKWNEELLLSVGFRHVDCFWRWMNFAGWIAIKPIR